MSVTLSDHLNHPAISVIVPVYNGERFLAEALRSIGQQDYQPLEVLVVDDGSTDRSAAVAAMQPDVRVLRKAHSGLGDTLNHGVAHATGELFAFLDADDRWLPDKLTRQVHALMANPALDMVFGHVRQFRQADADGEIVSTSDAQPGIHRGVMLVWRAALTRVGAFAEDPGVHGFVDWYARARTAGLRSAVLPDVLYERRIHDDNLGRRTPDAQRQSYLRALRLAVAHRRPDGAADA
jgi:glycosyltransferase involved in cell wall biosynthesis